MVSANFILTEGFSYGSFFFKRLIFLHNYTDSTQTEVVEPKASLGPFQDLNPVSLSIAEGEQAGLKRIELEIQLDYGGQAVH